MRGEEEIQTTRKCNSQNLHCSWSIRMHTLQYCYSSSGEPIIKNTSIEKFLSETVFGKNSAQLLETVRTYQETDPPKQTNKPLNTDTKKPNPRSVATQRSPVYKNISALGLETIS